MASLADLGTQAETIAGKAGIPPDKVRAIGMSLKNNLQNNPDKKQALEATARENGISVDKVQEVLGHAGFSGGLDKIKGMFG